MLDPIVKAAGVKLRASDVLDWLEAHPGATIVVAGRWLGKSDLKATLEAAANIVEKDGLKIDPLERGRTDVR
jgi:hypothetical protein